MDLAYWAGAVDEFLVFLGATPIAQPTHCRVGGWAVGLLVFRSFPSSSAWIRFVAFDYLHDARFRPKSTTMSV